MENLTPMLRQYKEVKKDYPDCILFFRMGDFYEMFYEDARKASGVLDLVLTSRSSGKSGKVPMCGLPFHAAESYISKLIKSGSKVAICEQVEEPSEAKGIVKREVVRVITSGTFIDDNSREARCLLSIYADRTGVGVSFISAESGTIYTNQYKDKKKIAELVSKISVYECVYPESSKEYIEDVIKSPLFKVNNINLTEAEDWKYNLEISRNTIKRHFETFSLESFGIADMHLSARSVGGLLEYLKEVNKKYPEHINRISVYTDSRYLHISSPAVYGLELQRLLDVLDGTSTPMGRRCLKNWLYQPLLDTEEIRSRQDAVRMLIEKEPIRKDLLSTLHDIPDGEKAISRLSCGYGKVKDILFVMKMVFKIPLLKEILDSYAGEKPLFQVEDIPGLRAYIQKIVNPDISSDNYEGRFVREGYNVELDSLRDIRNNARQLLKNLQKQEIEKTGINSLKIGFNKVFGYYIEVTKSNLSLVPSRYIRKQTLVNAERFITPELKEFEEKILTAEEKIYAIENRIIEEVKDEIVRNAPLLYGLSQSIANLDVLACFAVNAIENDYIRPEVDSSFDIFIKEGRHPVVEKMSEDFFVPNDFMINRKESTFLVITGPNMAGKSTYIRQVGLLVIMAQAGSFIPAAAARIGLVDKVFTRIGAHDDISRGQSTFMVEMTETAEIINNFSGRSLIILDEIGRGTSTYDGFSLAWSVAEYLQSKKVRTLFATHFHELTALSEKYEGVRNYNVAVEERGEEIVFLHKIMPGSSDDSYGIYVAKLAGLPQILITRAGEIIEKLELQGTLQERIIGELSVDNNSLFSKEEPPYREISEDIKRIKAVKEEILSLKIDEMTPLEALLQIKRIQERLNDGKG